MSDNQQRVENTGQNLFWKMLLRGIVALIASAIVPAIIFFVGLAVYFTTTAASAPPSESLVDATNYGVGVALILGL